MGRPPDFSKQTSDTLAKRAGYLCTNPDCNAPTVGANKNPEKSVNTGEAAHIYGAKLGSARFDDSMTDKERAQIVNAIWLCNRCHKLVDDGPIYYNDKLLYKWKEFHDFQSVWAWQKKSASMKSEIAKEELIDFTAYPPRVQRIIIDKAGFWEAQLAKELLNFILAPILLKYASIKSGAFVPETIVVRAGEEPFFMKTRLVEAERLIKSLSILYARDLVSTWGPEGIAGDEKANLNVCQMIGRTVSKMVEWEMVIHGVVLEDEEFINVVGLLRDAVGMQLEEVKKMNEVISNIVQLASENQGKERITIEHTMLFTLPDQFVDQISTELLRIAEVKGH